MQLLNKIKIAAVLFCLCPSAFSASLKGVEEARQLTDQVMEKVASDDEQGGLRLLFKSASDTSESEISNYLKGWHESELIKLSQFGRRIGSEFIQQDAVGENLVRIVQFERFETAGVIAWSFYFYRSNDGWVLVKVKSDEDITKLFTTP